MWLDLAPRVRWGVRLLSRISDASYLIGAGKGRMPLHPLGALIGGFGEVPRALGGAVRRGTGTSPGWVPARTTPGEPGHTEAAYAARSNGARGCAGVVVRGTSRHCGRSGVTVIGVSPAEALDNFAILATLSGRAAEWAASRITPAALAELRRQAARLAAASPGPTLMEAKLAFSPHH
jgi:hypothetical protein